LAVVSAGFNELQKGGRGGLIGIAWLDNSCLFSSSEKPGSGHVEKVLKDETLRAHFQSQIGAREARRLHRRTPEVVEDEPWPVNDALIAHDSSNRDASSNEHEGLAPGRRWLLHGEFALTTLTSLLLCATLVLFRPCELSITWSIIYE
jgi:hypothetical protein